MDAVRVELPASLLKAANVQGNPSQDAPRLLGLELYRKEKVSLSRDAELRETPRAAFIDFVARHGVPPLRYSLADLEQERRSADRAKT